MCGLTGAFWQPGEVDADTARQRLEAMTTALAHRGPDDAGVWMDAALGVGLGHRRLSILDLSPAGHQPIDSPAGRYVMVFNGEIYNHLDLRAALEAEGHAPAWRGTGDSETLMAGFDAWGLQETIEKAIGMFAIAVWDRRERRLSLVRDRFGEKPLYYGWQGTGAARAFLFGSELKALTAHPACERRIDRAAIAEVLRHSAVGHDRCIYEGLAKVAPGCIVTVSPDAPEAVSARYWSIEVVAARGVARQAEAPSRAEAVDQLDALLGDAVGRQMLSDVPLGAFLSGGIDSSVVTALMQRHSTVPVRTFSIGFDVPRYNEAEHAKAVAAHLGTDHTELYVGERELLDVVPALPTIYDEPFADPSQIPTFLVARLARQHVTVAVSGDGGDELFGGYYRYRQAMRLNRLIGASPLALRRAGAGLIRALPPKLLNRLLATVRPVPEGKEPGGQWLRRLADYAASRSVDELHRKMVSFWRFPLEALPGTEEAPSRLTDPDPALAPLSPGERMMAHDTGAYMVDDILAKVDRATMAVSLESRAPLLDHRIAAFAWSLPLSYRLGDAEDGSEAKWVLRQVLYRHVPPALVDRPKMGFEAPTGAWLRGPLRDWAEALIAPERLARDGWFAPAVIRRIWDEHQGGHGDWRLQLWNVLMFQAWLDANAAAGAETAGATPRFRAA